MSRLLVLDVSENLLYEWPLMIFIEWHIHTHAFCVSSVRLVQWIGFLKSDLHIFTHINKLARISRDLHLPTDELLAIANRVPTFTEIIHTTTSVMRVTESNWVNNQAMIIFRLFGLRKSRNHNFFIAERRQIFASMENFERMMMQMGKFPTNWRNNCEWECYCKIIKSSHYFSLKNLKFRSISHKSRRRMMIKVRRRH